MQCQSNSWTICMWQLMGVITDYHRILFPDWMTCNVNHKSTSKKTRVLLGCGTKSLLSSSRRRQANWRSAGGYKQKRQWCHSGGHEGRRRGDASPQPCTSLYPQPFLPLSTHSQQAPLLTQCLRGSWNTERAWLYPLWQRTILFPI